MSLVLNNTTGLYSISGSSGSGLSFGSGSEFTDTGTKTANYTAVTGDNVLLDLSSASGDVTVTLPSTPATGNKVKLTLISESSNYNVIINSGASSFMSDNDPRFYDLCITGDTVTLIYQASKWIVTNKFLRAHKGKMSQISGNISNTNTTLTFTSTDYNVGNVVTSSTVMTPRRKGYYKCTFRAVIANVGSGNALRCFVNGSQTTAIPMVFGSGSITVYAEHLMNDSFLFNKGDTISYQSYYNGSASYTLYSTFSGGLGVNGGFTFNRYPAFTLEEIMT